MNLKEEESTITEKRLFFGISALGDLGEEITSTNKFNRVMKYALYMVLGTLSVSKGAILYYNSRKKTLTIQASKGLDSPENTSFRLKKELVNLVVKEKEFIHLLHPKDYFLPFWETNKEALEKIYAYLWIPLIVKNEFIGFISLDKKFQEGEYTKSDFYLLAVMAHHISVGIHNHMLYKHIETVNAQLKSKIAENNKLYKDLEKIYNDTIKALGAAIDAKDPYTRGHSNRVAKFSVAIAKELKLSDNEINAINIASHLHDIGKIAIDSCILSKPSKLTKEEFALIRRHPLVSYDILSHIEFPYPDVALFAKHHHEKVNGEGYPDGKKAGELPLAVRIIALADVFDAMTSDRPYRPGINLEDALLEIKEQVFKHFDPEVAKTFFDVLKREINGEITAPQIISQLNNKFDPEIIINFLEKITQELTS